MRATQKIIKTIYPDKPLLSFNEWINYVHNQYKKSKICLKN